MTNPTHYLPDTVRRRIWVHADGCWNWCGAIGTGGYGQLKWEGKRWQAHRVVWALSGRTLLDGLVLDHLCRNRRCCNPDHLRQVTDAENILAEGSESTAALNAAKTFCPSGHPYDDTNVYTYRGSRQCRTCRRLRKRAS